MLHIWQHHALSRKSGFLLWNTSPPCVWWRQAGSNRRPLECRPFLHFGCPPAGKEVEKYKSERRCQGGGGAPAPFLQPERNRPWGCGRSPAGDGSCGAVSEGSATRGKGAQVSKDARETCHD